VVKVVLARLADRGEEVALHVLVVAQEEVDPWGRGLEKGQESVVAKEHWQEWAGGWDR